jgi:hypothetical protein
MTQTDLYQLYQKYCSYQITDMVQELDVEIDIERLRTEVFNFIVENNFGYKGVSLRMPPGNTNYVDEKESLVSTASNIFARSVAYKHKNNLIPDSEYTVWHPAIENSYLASLVPLIEQYSGFSIGRARLGWLQPDEGYPMHNDLEPMRIHIPIFTNNFAYILHNNSADNMKYGKLYHLLAADIHTAWNFGKFPRLHLIFSTHGNAELSAEIEKLDDIIVSRGNYADHIKNQGVDGYSLSQIDLIDASLKNS